MLVLSIFVFAGALALSSAVIVASIAPQWERIVRLAMGNIEHPVGVDTRVTTEQRVAVRRWASAPIPAPIHRLRAAA